MCNSQLVVPRSGIYFLSWNSASVAYTFHQIFLKINGQLKGRTIIYDDYFNGTDISSCSLLLHLNEGDILNLYLHPNPSTAQIVSNDNYQLSFTGFLYEPNHGTKIAWTLIFPNGNNTIFNGPTIINFNTVLLNEGSVQNTSSKSLVIPVDGVYYLGLCNTSVKGMQFNLVL